MSTFLLVRGLEPVEIDMTFDGARHRVNEAKTGIKRNGKDEMDKHRPLHHATFHTVIRDEDEDSDDYGEIIGIGRIAPDPKLIIGVGSDEQRDVNTTSNLETVATEDAEEEEEYDTDDEEEDEEEEEDSD